MGNSSRLVEAAGAYVLSSRTGLRSYNSVRIHLMKVFGDTPEVSETVRDMRNSPPEGIEYDGIAFVAKR